MRAAVMPMASLSQYMISRVFIVFQPLLIYILNLDLIMSIYSLVFILFWELNYVEEEAIFEF